VVRSSHDLSLFDRGLNMAIYPSVRLALVDQQSSIHSVVVDGVWMLVKSVDCVVDGEWKTVSDLYVQNDDIWKGTS